MGVFLSNSLSSVTSLHAQILVSKGTDTSFEVAAFSESMTIGNALAPWHMGKQWSSLDWCGCHRISYSCG